MQGRSLRRIPDMLKFVKYLFILLLLAGCVKPIEPDPDPEPEPNEEELFKDPQGNKILSPVSIPFVYGNPIEIIFTNDPRISKVEIRGLKNKVIENRINQEINDKIDDLIGHINAANLPPFRGIYAKIPADSVAVDYYINSYVSYNFDNILSVSFSGWYNFTVNGMAEYVSVLDALNYDLTTGQPLTVSDLLTNDVDVQRVLSNPLSELIKKGMDLPTDQYWGTAPTQLVAPFKGIKGNQVFFITTHGIIFIFDYRNPEFNNGFFSTQVMLEYFKLMPYLAIADRFKSDKNIYENPIRHAEFLHLTENAPRDDHGSEVYKDIDIYTYRAFQKDVPAFYINKIPDVLAIVKTMIDEYSGERKIEHAYATHYAEKVGEFINLSWYTSIYSDEITYQESRQTYNRDGELMTLEDLFVDGFKYRDFLWGEFEKNIQNLHLYDKEIILDSIKFTIGHAGISFSASQPKTDESPAFNGGVYLSYNDIGMENLTIFNDE
jgi:hypothetical protein